MSVNSKMTAIADAIRSKTGGTGSLTLDEMADAIDGIEIGVELPTLTNEGSASDLLSGKQLIDQEGNIVTGAIATKTASNLTASGAVVTVPAGYYAAQATKSVSTATQATPSISVDSSGLITATATQDAGYVASGTKSGTKQLAFQPAKTITPSTASQIAVSGGYYTGGNITVKAIPSQYVIPSGTLTISTNGTHDVKNYASAVINVEGGGGSSGEAAEWSENEDAIITRTLSNYTNDRVKLIGDYAFQYCISLTTVDFPVCKAIGQYAFLSCSSLTTINFPACTNLGTSAFRDCYSLTIASFPICTAINAQVFRNCYSLTTINFPVCTGIGSSAFVSCYNLKSLYLTGSSICRLAHSNAFTSTPIGGYSASAGVYGYIYVPSSLVASYQAATNWTYFSSRIVAYDSGNSGGAGD